MGNKVKVGYIGWLSYDQTEYSTPYAVCDINAAKLRAYCQEHPEVKSFSDYRDMAGDPELDVVVISTPNWLHCEMTEAFLQKGKHVFCEKPMGINRAEMNRMLRAQRASGKQLALDFEMRISCAARRIKDLLDSGEFGALRGIEFTHHRGGWLAEGAMLWRTDPRKSGGLYFMEICHEVDIFRYFAGEITHVQSFKTPNVLPQYAPDMPDNVITHLFFKSGAMGSIATSHTVSVFTAPLARYHDLGHDMAFVLTGSAGALRLDCITERLLLVKYRPYPAGSHGKRVELERIEDFSGRNAFHDIDENRRAFIRSCAEGRPHVQDAYDAWRTHCVCLAAEHSALHGFKKEAVDYTGG
ncbi:MAG: Gfo/Idh/MocA family oxidoreductase [Planctomycetota bacterium]